MSGVRTAVNRWWWIWGWISLLAAVALPVARRQTHGTAKGGCTLDGMPSQSLTRVRVIGESSDPTRDAKAFEFCSLRCAEWWLRAKGMRPQRILVTDESSGEEIEAREAIFVRSEVVVHDASHDRRHVFRSAADAESHAKAYHGRVLTKADVPFAALRAD